MVRNPAPHQIDPRVHYLRVKPNCHWAGIILNNVIVEQCSMESDKDLQKLITEYEAKHETTA